MREREGKRDRLEKKEREEKRRCVESSTDAWQNFFMRLLLIQSDVSPLPEQGGMAV